MRSYTRYTSCCIILVTSNIRPSVPKEAFSKPPIVWPTAEDRSSVDLPMIQARGMMARKLQRNTEESCQDAQNHNQNSTQFGINASSVPEIHLITLAVSDMTSPSLVYVPGVILKPISRQRKKMSFKTWTNCKSTC